MERKYKIYVFIITILIISIAIILVNVNKRSFYIVLKGENPIIIYEGNTYEEPGYAAFDSHGKDATNLVKVDSNLDVNHEGEYKVIYVIEKRAEVTRNIIVKEVIPDNLEVEFSLNGNLIQDLNRDNQYQEKGYKAIGNNGRDYSKYVSVEGIVDSTKVGTYQITYNLNVGSVQKSLIRTINVVGQKYSLNLSNSNYTNGNVIISIKNNLKDFKNFLSPSGIEVESEKIDFVATNNGKYTFYLFDKRNHSEKIEVTIKNIDRILPKAECKGKVEGKNKIYEIIAEDENGIAKYVYNGKESIEPTFTVLNNNENDIVMVYDKAENVTETLCEYDEISGKSNIIANYKSETLKYWIEKPTSTYTITHIWVKDSYKQFKVANNAKIGTLETAKTILNREISKNKYYSKGMVVINASAFVRTSENPFAKYNKAWLNTSDAPIIIADGVILRDFTTQALPSNLYPVYGLKNNGYMTYYNFDAGEENVAKNKKTLETIKSQGVNYTFSFNPILVENNEVKVNTTSQNIRQGLCQIDRNNFIIITNINSTSSRTKGLSFKELAEMMQKLDCKTGFNLDGGGSVNLYYKKSSKDFKTIKSSNRKIADILYFVEQ